MSTLFVDRRDIELEIDAGALVVRDHGARIGTVPLAPITRVFLRGSATLHASVLGELGERGIGVVILSGRKSLPTLFFGRPHNDARLRVEQIRKSLRLDFCLKRAQGFVTRKLANQHDWLAQLRTQRPQARYPLTHAMGLISVEQEKIGCVQRQESLLGIEGSAASAYFSGLRAIIPASLNFNGRNRRPPRDPFNALLSLTYTLVQAETAFALHAAGFDPCIGYYHRLSFSRESLACDLMEPLRPIADRFCLQLVSSQTLVADHFSTSSAGCLLGKAGRTRYYHAYEEYAPTIRKGIQNEIELLADAVAPDYARPGIGTLTETLGTNTPTPPAET